MPNKILNGDSLDLSTFKNKVNIDAVSDGSHTVRLVTGAAELVAVLKLRYNVFKLELSDTPFEESESTAMDFDAYDLGCDHLIVFDNQTRKAVGTYRLNTIESAGDVDGFYASTEFDLRSLPPEVINSSIELGRACIAKEHRNMRILFLLWKGLANYCKATKKRYLFGCCSIFTQDGEVAGNVYHQLGEAGHIHDSLRIEPRQDRACIPNAFKPDAKNPIELPALVNIYLRIGAKICGEPAIDREFKTVDYFVVFDRETISKKYFAMFFA